MEPRPGADGAPIQGSAKPVRARPPGSLAGTVALLLAAVICFLPTHFMIKSPGPMINTLGEMDGHELVSVADSTNYPSDSQLDMTTLLVQGGGQHRVTVPVILEALVNPAKDIVPEEMMLPRGTTSAERLAENDSMMASSQDLAVAAAFNELGIGYTTTLTVAGFGTDTNRESLREGDVLVAINGEDIKNLAGLKTVLTERGEQPSTLTVRRDGKTVQATVHTTAAGDGTRQIGIYLQTSFAFDKQVDFAVENIGGPSAGMMFALAIIDKLTEGSLAGDTHVAGTGAITDDGQVEAIGGIAQKLVAASRGGVHVFLAPAANCPDVQGRVPKGLDVVKVSTLAEARGYLEQIAKGTDPATLPTCEPAN